MKQLSWSSFREWYEGQRLCVPYLPVFLALMARGYASQNPRFDNLVIPLLFIALTRVRQNDKLREKTLRDRIFGPVTRVFESNWVQIPALMFWCVCLLAAIDQIIEKL